MKYYVLDRSIDIAQERGSNFLWTPIGDSTTGGTFGTYFSATFDGDFKTIYNLKISGTRNDLGLFGYLNNGGQILNLKLNNPVVEALQKGQQNTAGIAGYIRLGKIENVSVTNAKIYGSNRVGGIVGYAWDSKIIDSDFYGEVKAIRAGGGIVGELLGDEISNVKSGASIGINSNLAESPLIPIYIAGIAGEVSSANRFTKTAFIGLIEGGDGAGGIVNWPLLASYDLSYYGLQNFTKHLSFGSLIGTNYSNALYRGLIYGDIGYYPGSVIEKTPIELPDTYFLLQTECVGCNPRQFGKGVSLTDTLQNETFSIQPYGFQNLN